MFLQDHGPDLAIGLQIALMATTPLSNIET